MRTRKQKIFLITKIVSIFFALVIAGLFVFRDAILQKAIVQITHKLDRDYNSSFSVKKANFIGISGVEMENVLLVPKKADTLFNIENLNTKINFWRLLTGTIQIEKLEAKNGFLQLVKNKNGRNFDAFLSKNKDTVDTGKKTNYAKLAYKLLNRALN